jgi:hypothetical protein
VATGKLSEGEKARNFARLYVNLVEALQQAGVTEEIAREEARLAALMTLQAEDFEEETQEYQPHLGPCPSCGRG